MFHYYVAVDDGHKNVPVYSGYDAAEAMAAWSKGVTEGHEYIVLEAIQETGK